MSANKLPPPGAVQKILIWHQGALGDLLLAGPALSAISRHYPQARITGLGHPERWALLAPTLSLEAVWDSAAAFWSPLFTSDSPLPAALKERLAAFQLALAFSPQPHPTLLARLAQAGIAGVQWLPSWPPSGGEPVGAFLAAQLARLGLRLIPKPFRLVIGEDWQDQAPPLSGPGPFLAVAPGSGHPCKNWLLTHYYEVSRALAWQHGMQVIWLTGPAEEPLIPYLKGLAAAQDHLLLAGLPLTAVAATLARCRLYLGGDSGLTHLAAAVGVPGVLALFGPTDPVVWAPRGEGVRVLSAPCPQAPCAPAREITCPEPRCMQDLSPDLVLATAAALLQRG
ncbi:MAG: glycosyltransferase family 9 protein [Deltaproteobacteria bacterium]|nr:glycosyltransferase family 9 protein [Deltaproteobacteria bacterium]MBI4796562.1 glycosyltransferase family 9 protein [Deltaproteobacteria bacterium]